MRGPRIVLLALCACGGSAVGPATDGTGPGGPTGKGGPEVGANPGPLPKAERKLVADIGDEPSVACEDRSQNTPEWREPPPPDKGFCLVDAIAFRSGCLSASLLDEAMAEREQDLVGCFDRSQIKDASVVMRTTWEGGATGAKLSKLELRAAPGAAMPAGAPALTGCLTSVLSTVADLGPEPALPAVVDVLLRRGFPDEVETLGVD